MTHIFRRKVSDKKLITELRAGGKRGEEATKKLYDQYHEEIPQLIERDFIPENDRFMAFVDALSVLIQEIRESQHQNSLSLRRPLLNLTLDKLPESHLIKLGAENTDIGVKACGILISRYEAYIATIIRNKLKGERQEKIKDAIGIAREAVLERVKNDKINNPKAFKGFCGSIAANKAVDLINKNKVTRKIFSETTEYVEAVDEGRMEDEIEYELKIEQVAKLRKYIGNLPDICKTLIEHRAKGDAWQVVADKIGWEYVKTKKRWTRCFTQLTNTVKSEDPELLRVLTFNRKRRGRK